MRVDIFINREAVTIASPPSRQTSSSHHRMYGGIIITSGEQEIALASLTSGGRSVGIVRLRTTSHGV
jgi:hypothetical protein